MPSPDRLRIAVIGTGVSGLSAAWLLQPRHDVTVYEKADRFGGHSNTVSVRLDGVEVPVDTGFIVYNAATYPNFVELLQVLEVESCESDMSFAASLDGGRIEYSGSGVAGLFSQRANLVRPQFWGMLADLVRFYRIATRDARRGVAEETSLGDYLRAGRFGAPFRDHHIVPMASAIWSAAPAEILDYPAASFLRFHDNHGLLRLTGRPIWRTVVGGSRAYVTRLAEPLAGRIRVGAGAVRVERIGGRVVVVDAERPAGRVRPRGDRHPRRRGAQPSGRARRAGAGAARRLPLQPQRGASSISTRPDAPSARGLGELELRVRGRIAGSRRRHLLDERAATASDPQKRVRHPQSDAPASRRVLRVESYDHPIFDGAAIRAQKDLWSLQGAGGVWFCGAHFGAGFHEDGLQSGLAVAEQLGDVRRPWRVAGESARIVVGAAPPAAPAREEAA